MTDIDKRPNIGPIYRPADISVNLYLKDQKIFEQIRLGII